MGNLKEIRDAIGTACSNTHEFEWLEVKYKIRTISPLDEVFIFERASAEAKSQIGRLILIRIYAVALMLEEIGGVNIKETMFTDWNSSKYDDEARKALCDFAIEAFSKWDRRSFRLLFKYCWAWNEAHAADLLKDRGIESFMTPEEQDAYRELQKLEAVEAVQSGIEPGEISDTGLSEEPPIEDEIEE